MGVRTASPVNAAVAAKVLAALALVLASTVPLSISGGVGARPAIDHPDMWSGYWVHVLIIIAFTICGAALLHVRPRNLIGWVLLGVGLLQAVQSSFDAYGARALTDPDGSLPLGLFAIWLGSWTWIPAVLLPVLLLPSLYPTGSPPSRFWRWHCWVSLAGIAAISLGASTTQDGVDDTVRTARLPFDAPEWWAVGVGVLAVSLLAPAAAVSLVGTVVRTVQARSPERQQLLWLLCVVTAMVATVFLPWSGVFALSYGLVPVAVVVGVLRYQLLGIEIAMRRTLLYVPLTLLVALVVGGMTAALARLTPEGWLPLLLASAVVALLVLPVASKLRKVVDRFVLGDRADPLSVVDRVGAGLEVATDPVASMLEAVATSAGASYAAVLGADRTESARLGEPVPNPVELPLRHGGELLGTLIVGPRRGEPRVLPGDARILEALAPHLAVVLRSRRLTDELARERERVLAATLSERERLRRDLHDGLGPSLSGIALGLEAADHAFDQDPQSARDLLARSRAEAESAVREIRGVLDALRPSALDRNDLSGAISETAKALGLGGPGEPFFSLAADGVQTLPAPVEEAAFRIVAESLTNVAKHAGASRCQVRLTPEDGALHINVEDDGLGLREGPSNGVGLGSMRERASGLGGRFEVGAVSPHGTLVHVELPLGRP